MVNNEQRKQLISTFCEDFMSDLYRTGSVFAPGISFGRKVCKVGSSRKVFVHNFCCHATVLYRTPESTTHIGTHIMYNRVIDNIKSVETCCS